MMDFCIKQVGDCLKEREQTIECLDIFYDTEVI